MLVTSGRLADPVSQARILKTVNRIFTTLFSQRLLRPVHFNNSLYGVDLFRKTKRCACLFSAPQESTT